MDRSGAEERNWGREHERQRDGVTDAACRRVAQRSYASFLSGFVVLGRHEARVMW